MFETFQLNSKAVSEWDSVFFHFIYCVWEILQQRPLQFEFCESLLVCVVDALHSSRFGTFLFNSEKERQKLLVETQCVSVFSYIRAKKVRSSLIYFIFHLSNFPRLFPRFFHLS